MELVCPAGSLAALDAAINSGADSIYVGLRDGTNARSFPGLNFSSSQLEDARKLTLQHGRKLFLAVNTYAQAGRWCEWQRAVDIAAGVHVDALIAADMGVLDYAASRHPGLDLHLSVQGSATNWRSLRLMHGMFGIKRAVLPRVLSLKQVERLVDDSPVPLEVFGFGSLCIMVEGRCQLSSYVTGQSPNTCGVCSPAKFVRWNDTPDGLESRLNGKLIDRFEPGVKAGYPTVCKGRYDMEGRMLHALEEPVSLNTMSILPRLLKAGVVAIKLEGRQRSPAYIKQVAGVWRSAIDAVLRDPDGYTTQLAWDQVLAAVSEGAQTTLGAYTRSWQ
ncbi:MAG: peptidase U32 family protein [Gammaproteobacteria bacterium]|nr:peptidase U32 family protein [Gammaproteobacteria bacterium]